MLEELGHGLITSEYIFLDEFPMISSKTYRRSKSPVSISQKHSSLSWSLLELMACGTPVLAEGRPMMEELIRTGVNGALWRGSPESLAQAIPALLQKAIKLKAWGLQAKRPATTNLPSAALPKSIEQLLKNYASYF